MKNLKFYQKLILGFGFFLLIYVLGNITASILTLRNSFEKVYNREMVNITESIFQIAYSYYQLAQDMVNNDIEVVDHFVSGRVSMDSARMIECEAENQITHEIITCRIPSMIVKNNMGMQEEVFFNNQLTHYIVSLIGNPVTFFQLIDEGLLSISSSVYGKNGQQAIRTLIPKESLVYKTLVAGEMYAGRAYMVDEWYISSYQPIFLNDKIIGAINTGIKQTELDVLGEVLKNFNLGHIYSPFVINPDGEVVIHPTQASGDNILNMQDKNGRFFIRQLCDDVKQHRAYTGQISYDWLYEEDNRAEERLIYFKYFPQMDWIIGVEIDKGHIYMPMFKQISISIFIAVMLFLIVFAFIILMSSAFTEQLVLIRDAVNQYFQNKFANRVPVKSNDELGLLARAFNNLADQLQGFYEDLETKVKDRTTELYFKNEELTRQKKDAENYSREIKAVNDKLSAVNLALSESEESYRRLIENLKEEYFFYSQMTDGSYSYISPSVETVLGYTVEEAMVGISHYFTDNPINQTAKGKTQLGMQGIKQVPFQVELWDKKNRQKIFEISESPVEVEGKILGVEGIAKDISAYMHAQKSLQKSNTKLHSQKQELQLALHNLKEAQLQLVQSEKLAALGQLISGIAHEINTPLGAINASSGNLAKSLDNAVKDLPLLIYRLAQDGMELFIALLKYVQWDLPELTSRKRRELKKQIVKKLQGNKLDDPEAVAELMIYMKIYKHMDEIIPLLDYPNADFIITYTRNIVSLQRNTNNIAMAVDKASKVVFALRKFIHKDQQGEKVPIHIQESIETVLTLYHNQIKEGIHLTTNFGDLPPVHCISDEINQVWSNIIQNAIQAMDNRGNLSITTSRQGNFAKIMISDTGGGIPEELHTRIFEPFFTTKPQGEGSGLGLDIVKNIIEKHQGEIFIESQIGVGTSFVILLPLNQI